MPRTRKTQTATINASSIERSIDMATAGLQPYLNSMLKEVKQPNGQKIAEYVLAMQSEFNPTPRTRKNLVFSLIHFSNFHRHKAFTKMSREDVLEYLNSYRKTEESDPMHRWIGTYNVRRATLLKFFRWVFNPEMPAEERPVPALFASIKQLRRKEVSVYKPTDLWTDEEDVLFLKYCPHKRIRCYHAMARDTSARPHELLKLKIRDVVFKSVDGVQYAEVVLSGKTTQRAIPLFSAVPYVKDWLDEHPLRNNPDAPLFTSTRGHIGKPLSPNALGSIYTLAYNEGVSDHRKGFYEGYFRRLLKNPEVSPEDRAKLEVLLQKPWNPYVFRHAALTKKARVLREHVLRQHAGWGLTSRMPQKYLHFFGSESSEDLLVEYGLVKKEKSMIDILKPLQCPNCKEPNKTDAKFCVKCRMVLSFSAYEEQKTKEHEKEKQLEGMQDKMGLTIAYMMETDPEKKAEISRKLIEKGYVPRTS